MENAVLEPARAQEFMQHLPLAVALLVRDERVAWGNQRFGELFDLNAFAARELARQCGPARRRALHLAAQKGETGAGTLVEFLAREVLAQHLLGAGRDFFALFATAQTAADQATAPHTTA